MKKLLVVLLMVGCGTTEDGVEMVGVDMGSSKPGQTPDSGVAAQPAPVGACDPFAPRNTQCGKTGDRYCGWQCEEAPAPTTVCLATPTSSYTSCEGGICGTVHIREGKLNGVVTRSVCADGLTCMPTYVSVTRKWGSTREMAGGDHVCRKLCRTDADCGNRRCKMEALPCSKATGGEATQMAPSVGVCEDPKEEATTCNSSR